ncbi:ribose-phosphate pyrophosphokinase [Halogranum gelatinilyticum]|uniref:Ribose-phosphate pyrophosphokinase n=1 Tax=Halogranum gelatinilyticum TaxID=660521 RepID=A0A1G9PEF8_9EURY|nr:ribose-phosphate diphosphokinase [Halogranum gelatinilyticum]SDL97139.1 ribose-phosphate pyrophosphokinase [Halogranum gelatinilyticum]
MILPGSTSQALAAALAEATGEPLATAEYRTFPDGELLAAADALAEETPERAVVVASTTTSDAHLELLQLQDAAREAGVNEVVTVIPYMGYARQDSAFKPGQPVSARAVAKAVSTGTDRVLLVNPHEPGISEFFDVPCENVDAAPALADPLPPKLADPLFLSPDAGAVELAETVRDAYGAGDTDYFEKERDYETGAVEISPSDASVEGRDVVLVDDIIATGSTMSESIEVLHQRGVGRVYVTCVHPLLAANARTKLASAGVAGLYGTDTIERDVSTVSVAGSVADAL